MTHLFNGMNGIHHRAPGPVCAAYDTPGVFVELICDGIHIHPSVIRMVFDLFPGHVILISATLNPARQLHLDQQIGSIEDGKKADFLICSESLQLLQVYIGGSPVPA